MSNRKVKNYALIAILVIYLAVYKLFIFPKHMGVSEIVNTSFLVAYLALAIKLFPQPGTPVNRRPLGDGSP